MSKYLNDKDFFVCTGGMMPTQMLALQNKTGKQDNGGLYLREHDVYTTPVADFACKKLMLLMAVVAVVVCALTVATGGAALIAAAAIGGLAGAAIGSLICGSAAAMARMWIGYKPNVMIGGQKALTDKAHMICRIFGDEIHYTPYVKTWSQAILFGLSNFAVEMFKCVMVGAAAAGLAVIATEGIAAFMGNALLNYARTWIGEGLLLRLGFAANQVVQDRFNTGDTDGSFAKGFWGMETGTAQAASHIKDAVTGDTGGLFQHGNEAMDRASRNASDITKPLAYVCAGTGYMEDFTTLLGWGAGQRSGSTDPVFGRRSTVEPNTNFDPMGGQWEGKPQRGKTGYLESSRMSRAELQEYKSGLQEKGVEVVVDKKGVLPEQARAGFDPQTGKVYLRKGATNYEAFHERAHAEQWAEMGKENYLKQSRLQREQHVYDQIMKNKERFSDKELEHARNYMNEVRRQAGVDPLDAMEEMAGKGGNTEGKAKQPGKGDTFEDPAIAKAAEEAKAREEQKAKEQEALIAARRQAAIDFYKKHNPKMSIDDIRSHISGIDFTKPVEVVKLPKETELYQYTKENIKGEKLRGDYYSDNPKNTPDELGISDRYNKRDPDNKWQHTDEIGTVKQEKVSLEKDVEGLKSTSAEINDTWSLKNESVHTKGGGSQIYIPKGQ